MADPLAAALQTVLDYVLDDNQLCEPCEGGGHLVKKGGEHLPLCVFGRAEKALRESEAICADCQEPRGEHGLEDAEMACPGEVEDIRTFTDRFPR